MPNDQVSVEVESLAFGGDAVGRQQGGEGARAADDGRATFVPLAAPGERVRVRIEREKGKVAWGELVAIERPGPERVPPPCPLFGTCGGCQWQHVTTAAQHAAKRAIVERALGMPLTAVRRRQPALRLSRSRQAGGRAGGTLGFRARRSHDLVDVPACPLFGPELARALPALRATARGLAAGVEIDVQAGDDGVHVNVAQADPTSAAHARREIDRLGAAGVVGLSLAGKPTLGRPDVDVAEPGSPPLRIPADGFAQVGPRRKRGPRRGRDGSGRSVAGRRVRALRRQWELDPPPGAAPARRPWRRPTAIRPRSPAARATCPRRPGRCGRRPATPTPSCSIRRATARTRRTWRSPRARAGASSTCRAIRRRWQRDARLLKAAGFALTAAVALDLMPQTFHVEVVATFDRPGTR